MKDGDGITVREIVLWALTHHRDAVGDHLDLSDEELQKLFQDVEWIQRRVMK